jgi:hypothetical protein
MPVKAGYEAWLHGGYMEGLKNEQEKAASLTIRNGLIFW